MKIIPMEKHHLNSVCTLWNTCIENGDMIYKKLNVDDFEHRFMQQNDRFETVGYVALESETVVGFSSGTNVYGKDTAYITTVVVDGLSRRRGIGTHLLHALEQQLTQLNPHITTIDVVFFNPVNLEWIIPHTNYHDHPNAPGIDMSSMGYLFLQRLGYKDFAIQNSYYRTLKDYQFSSKILSKLPKLETENLVIEVYDKHKHHGFSALFEDLGSSSWRHEILGNYEKNAPHNPVLIVHRDGRIGGFTGPLYVQPSGRGYFAGIGVHSEFRGHGAGRVLFGHLCKTHKEMGATYMTLFTGESNNARYIYEQEGFTIVRTWADMRKNLRK